MDSFSPITIHHLSFIKSAFLYFYAQGRVCKKKVLNSTFEKLVYIVLHDNVYNNIHLRLLVFVALASYWHIL